MRASAGAVVWLYQVLSLALKVCAGPWGGNFWFVVQGCWKWLPACISLCCSSLQMSCYLIWATVIFFFHFPFSMYRYLCMLWNFDLVCTFSGGKQTQKLPERGFVEPEEDRTCRFEKQNLSLDKNWSPGAYTYVHNKYQCTKLFTREFILGTKICKSVIKIT